MFWDLEYELHPQRIFVSRALNFDSMPFMEIVDHADMKSYD
jgi:hypothetical protein